MLKRISLKYRIIIGCCLAVIIPFLIAGPIIYIQLSGALIQHAQDDVVDAARDIARFIDIYLNQEIKLASSIAANPETIKAARTGDYRSAQKMLDSVHNRIGNKLFTFFIADKDGIARADAQFPEQLGLDLSDRGYFKDGQKGKTSLAGPIQAKGTATPGEFIMLLSVPIMDKDEFLGIVGIPFNTSFIVGILSSGEVVPSGDAFLINEKGMILIHSRKEYILNLNLFEQPGSQKIKSLVQSGTDGAAALEFNGVKKIAGLAGVENTGWIAVYSQDRDKVMLPVKRILFSIFISGLIFLFITIVTIIILSGKISSPIDKNMEIMRQVTRNSNELIAQIDLGRQFIYLNPAYEKFMGLTAEQILGTQASFSPLDAPATQVWESLEAGLPWSGRISVQKNGGNAPLEVMLVPLRNARGVILGYLEIGRDITSELMFETRLRQSQKLEAIGTLAGGIAHDFNNILTGISAYAELCLLKKDSTLQTEKYIKEILIASDRARELVSQILAFSRKADMELRPMSPKTVLKEALKLLRAAIPTSIDIQKKLDSDSVILADPTQFHQLIMNLLTNAVHAIGDNTGTIKVTLEDLMVDEEFIATHPNIKPGEHILIQISDSGTGIEPTVLDHIFEPFYTTKPLGEGAGLGLSVVHGIIQSFNGIITVYSQPGEGAAFNIIIPCQEADVAAIEQQEPSYLEGDEKLAFIDDEESIVSAMQAILANLGYTVTGFTDSESALIAIKKNPENFDVIITDYSMPKLTGLELAQKIIEAGINIPIILTSGYFSENVEDKARKIGVSSLVAKPVNTYKITKAIHQSRNEAPRSKVRGVKS